MLTGLRCPLVGGIDNSVIDKGERRVTGVHGSLTEKRTTWGHGFMFYHNVHVHILGHKKVIQVNGYILKLSINFHSNQVSIASRRDVTVT